MSQKDNIYQQKKSAQAFRFDETVASVFPDMIKRSVPGYEIMLEMISVISNRYVSPGSLCYDLGCSLGASTYAIANGIQHKEYTIKAIDNSSAMLAQARKNLSDSQSENIEFIQQDINLTNFLGCKLVCLNFTLQFIAEEKRQSLLQRIFNAMQSNSVIIISEKIIHPNENEQIALSDLHHDFKRAHGYSDLEIAQKRNALENVLIPETVEQHLTRLDQAGFSTPSVWFKCFNFVSFIAFKV